VKRQKTGGFGYHKLTKSARKMLFYSKSWICNILGCIIITRKVWQIKEAER